MSPSALILVLIGSGLLTWGIIRLAAIVSGVLGAVSADREPVSDPDDDPEVRHQGFILLLLALITLAAVIALIVIS